eukprot:1448388-Pleurochrysis_carterae.AAC.1
MPNPFGAPLTAEERKLFTLDSEDSDTVLPQEAPERPVPSTSQAAATALWKYTSQKGKYRRVNGKGIRVL